MDITHLPDSWQTNLQDEVQKAYFQTLAQFVEQERSEHVIFPPAEEVFTAFTETPYQDVKVVILGQDPYHGEGQAHGLCFSVKPGVKLPPSLRNIFKELQSDLDCEIPNHGSLLSWAKQGVFLLNTVLTVRKGKANSHRKKGWETFTDHVISLLSDHDNRLIFVLWGRPAQSKKKLIDEDRHFIIESVHPSPLSAKNGFFGSKPFSQVNGHLLSMGKKAIDWKIEDL